MYFQDTGSGRNRRKLTIKRYATLTTTRNKIKRISFRLRIQSVLKMKSVEVPRHCRICYRVEAENRQKEIMEPIRR